MERRGSHIHVFSQAALPHECLKIVDIEKDP